MKITQKIKHIVTHGGDAHRDDFMACCIAFAVFGIASIFRRDPTDEELEDPEVLVLDVGMRHEPDNMNFDHHQLPRDADPDCALSLLLRHLDLEKYFKVLKTYPVTVMLDSKGPYALAEHLGLPRTTPELASPIEAAILSAFEDNGKQTENHGWIWLQGAMLELGNRHISFAKAKSDHLDSLRDMVQTQVVNNVTTIIFETDNEMGIADIREQLYPGAGISILHDDRGPGWKLYRFADDPNVDFSKLDGDPAILFAHVNGFIAKTKERIPLSDVLALCEKAVV